ncbi:MAG: hypothetical protein AAGM38_12655 [Pseudomonadota bacterium]
MKSIYKPQILQRACEESVYAPDHSGVLQALAAAEPELAFRPAFERAGWHRIGRARRRDGSLVAEDLRAWAETELGDIGPEMTPPEDAEDYVATRIEGRTLYLVAPTGPRAWDFVQLELETLQEVMDRPLFPDEFAPSDIEEFLDPGLLAPGAAPQLEPTPIGETVYRFHGVSHIAQLREELDVSLSANRRFMRFLEEWERSRAAEARFCDHWVLRLFRYVDRFGEAKLEATPIPQRAIEPLAPEADQAGGADLARLLTGFDHQAGYAMAWYFQILTAQKLRHGVAEQVVKDHEGGAFAYLPERDLAVLRDWAQEPYCF